MKVYPFIKGASLINLSWRPVLGKNGLPCRSFQGGGKGETIAN